MGPRRSWLLMPAVLALHLAALQWLPQSARRPAAGPAGAMQTRHIEPAPKTVALPMAPMSLPVASPAAPKAMPRSADADMPSTTGMAAAAESAPPTDRPAATPMTALAPATHTGQPAPIGRAEAEPLRLSIADPVRLHYRVTGSLRGMPVEAQGELHWRHDGRSYEARLELNLPLPPRRIQHSAGQITAEGLAPQRYSQRTRSEEAAHFDRDRGAIRFSSNRPDAPLAAGAQDRLSLLLQLGAMIAGNPGRYPAGTQITVPTAGTREAEAWRFDVLGPETLDLPGGPVAAVRLVRLPQREYDQRIDLWLAPAMAWAPVRLRLGQANGDWLDQQWSSSDTP